MNDRTSSVHVRGVAAVRFASSASLSRALRNLKLHSDQPNVPPLSPQGLRWSSGRWFPSLSHVSGRGLILRRLLVAALQPAPRLDEDVAPLGGDAAHHRRAGRAGEHLDLLAEHSFGGAQAAQDDAASEALLAVHLAVGSAGEGGEGDPAWERVEHAALARVARGPRPDALFVDVPRGGRRLSRGVLRRRGARRGDASRAPTPAASAIATTSARGIFRTRARAGRSRANEPSRRTVRPIISPPTRARRRNWRARRRATSERPATSSQI